MHGECTVSRENGEHTTGVVEGNSLVGECCLFYTIIV